MEIKVRFETVCNKLRIYPVCEKAKCFAELIQNHRFLKKDIYYIRKLGFKIIVEPPGILCLKCDWFGYKKELINNIDCPFCRKSINN